MRVQLDHMAQLESLMRAAEKANGDVICKPAGWFGNDLEDDDIRDQMMDQVRAHGFDGEFVLWNGRHVLRLWKK